MKVFLSILVCVFIVYSCKDDNDAQFDCLPACIQNLIESPTGPTIKAIKIQKINNTTHFWINTDARHHDGTEDIVDQDCNRLCFFCGECEPPKCLDDYNMNDWKTVWEKK